MNKVIDITGHIDERLDIEGLPDAQRCILVAAPDIVRAMVTATAEEWGIVLNASQRDALVAELQRRAGIR